MYEWMLYVMLCVVLCGAVVCDVVCEGVCDCGVRGGEGSGKVKCLMLDLKLFGGFDFRWTNRRTDICTSTIYSTIRTSKSLNNCFSAKHLFSRHPTSHQQ